MKTTNSETKIETLIEKEVTTMSDRTRTVKCILTGAIEEFPVTNDE